MADRQCLTETAEDDLLMRNEAGQTLTIRHDSINRESFMPGVVLAAKKVRSLTSLTIGLDKLL